MIVTIILIVSIMLTNRGMWRMTGMVPPLLLYFPAAYGNYMGGINQPGNFFYALIIILVAVIYGNRKMWIAVLISLTTYLFFALMISNGYIIPERQAEGFFINRVVNTSVSLVAIAFMIWILSRNYRNEINVRIKAEELLKIKNNELRSLNEELHIAIEELESTNEEFETINNELEDSQDELVESNEKLRQSEKKFYQIFHSSPVPMTLNDYEKGHYIELNNALINESGFSREELIGKTPIEVGLISRKTMAIIKSILDEKGSIINHEFHARMKNGAERDILLNAYVSEIDNKKYTITTSIDITEKKFHENNLIKTQRLESLGLIAGGLAHDFNNLLMGILGNLTLARLNISDSGKALAYVVNSEEACARAQGLTLQLLTFAKGGLPVKSIFNPEKMIHSAAIFNLAGSRVRAAIKITGGLWNIEADEGQIGQVINNLFLNAVQSMPSGGTINITCENHTFKTEDPRMLSTGMAQPGKFVRMIFSDTGTGIPKNSIAKIFDPYYTTKQGGSGLGLAVVYSIITNHGGYVDVTSDVGSGSVFTVYIPASAMNGAADDLNKSMVPETDKIFPGDKNRPGEETKKSNLKILIMDDEKSIVSVLKSMLDHLGYNSDGAKGGTEAVEMYNKSLSGGQPYAAVILDLTIPGDIGGKEAIAILRENDPGIRAIVSSGYSDDPVFTDHESYGFRAILRKPFRIEDLSDALKKALQ